MNEDEDSFTYLYPAQATISNFNICFGARKCYCSDGFYSETTFVPGKAATVDTVAKPDSLADVEDEVDEAVDDVYEFDQS